MAGDARGSRAPADAAVLIYDGDCGLCRTSALWIMRCALGGGATQFEILPCRSSARRQRFPQVSEESCLTAMRLVLPDGRVLGGADAVPEILLRIPRWRWLARIFALPGVRPVARRIYAWIADNRMRLSCTLDGRR